MPKDKSILIKEYFKKIKSANKELTKKEAFKDLLNRLYAGNPETESVIDDITLGAEKTIVNIPRKDRLHSGSADTLYNKIIIEYENNLSTSYFPKFNEKQKTHLKLALLSEQAHAKAKAYIEANLPKQELSAIHLGRYRVEIKKHLKEEMEGIDELVGEMVG